jgi:hypothetical protein
VFCFSQEFEDEEEEYQLYMFSLKLDKLDLKHSFSDELIMKNPKDTKADIEMKTIEIGGNHLQCFFSSNIT